MGEPLRLRLLRVLEGGELNVSGLTSLVGSTQPNVSRHIKILLDGGLIKRRQDGAMSYYSIADRSIFEICNLVCDSLRAVLRSRAGVLGGHQFQRPLNRGIESE
jgi:ArsR family transcriptional regulator